MIRASALLVLIGLVIEMVSLHWAHPTAFIVFAAGTGACVGVGVVLFLKTLFASGPSVASQQTRSESLPE